LAQEAGVKRGVYTSSMSVHFRARDYYPDEDAVPLDSPSVYGLTKGLGEQVCAYFSRWFEMTIIGLRISGPRRRDDYLEQRRNPQRASDGSYVYPLDEEDLAKAYLRAIDVVAGAAAGFQPLFIVGDETQKEHNLAKAADVIGWRPEQQSPRRVIAHPGTTAEGNLRWGANVSHKSAEQCRLLPQKRTLGHDGAQSRFAALSGLQLPQLH